jgi:hypothetical protein
MAHVVATLKLTERDALVRLADREFRDPRAQAAVIIRRELERVGLLTEAASSTAPVEPGVASGHSN